MQQDADNIMEDITPNAVALHKEFDWLREIMQTRFHLYFGKETEHKEIFDIPPPTLDPHASAYGSFVCKEDLTLPERVLLLLALAPHVQPEVLDGFYLQNSTYDKPFTEFGLISHQRHMAFVPSGQTVLFLLAGEDMRLRFYYQELFDPGHFFARHKILWLSTGGEFAELQPRYGGRLVLHPDYIDRFTTGRVRLPDFSPVFPAKRLTTALEWEDLVLNEHTGYEVGEILSWLAHGPEIMEEWGLKRILKPGYRALFHGPPGTGKTLTASLIGKRTKRAVYRIDLSMIVSKYIGETEKNLANVFDQAEYKDWILFFDEADALFGKRTVSSSSNDRYANQEVSFLLQRVEAFPGMVILATNFKTNMDEAFMRRFQSVVHFPKPDVDQRLALWKKAFGRGLPLSPDVDFQLIADTYEITGGEIVNVLRYAALKSFSRPDGLVHTADILGGIRQELIRDGRIFEPPGR